MPSPWLEHLKKFRHDNPNFTGNVMVAARATYNKPAANLPNALAKFLETEILGNMVEKYGIAKTRIQQHAESLKLELDTAKSETMTTITNILSDYMDSGMFASQKGGCLLLSLISDNNYELVRKLIIAYKADGGTRFSNLSYDEE
jgi:hypothetical protein